MSNIELILTALTAVFGGGNIVQFIQLRHQQKTNDENVLLKRIEFLDERITRLEKLACFDEDCPKRK